MAIWSAEIKELEKLFESFKGQLPDLEKELEQLIRTEDANVIMLYSRRCLEVIITDLCECELKRPRKTEPLKGIIDKLHKEEKVPSHIITSMHGLNDLSTYGTHPKDFDTEQIKPVLNNLDIIIKWYLKYKETGTGIKAKHTEEISQRIKRDLEVRKSITISRKRLAGILGGSIGIIASVFAVLYFSNIIGGGKPTIEIDKSIAVLPFLNESPVDSNKYFINGIMEEVLTNLQKIKDFRVLSRTSTDQYKGQDRPTIPEIAKKLNVNYVVEGSGQKFGNKFVLRVQLITGKNERHLWAKSYDKEIKQTTDIISVQSEIAQLIAAELKTIISPEEKQLINKISTTNLTAHDFYQRGKDELTKFEINNYNKAALGKAENLFYEALKYDSTYAQAYTGLAEVYWSKHSSAEDYFSKNFMDSVFKLCDIALSFDNKLAEAYAIRGNYYAATGIFNKAIDEYDKSLKYNPNSWEAFSGKGDVYFDDDLVNSINNLQKAASLNHGLKLPDILRKISLTYSSAGFIDKARYYDLEAFKLDGDSALYLNLIALSEKYQGNFERAIKYLQKSFLIDSIKKSDTMLHLGHCYMFLHQPKETLRYYKKYVEILNTLGTFTLNDMHRIGWAYWENGYKKEADYYFDKQNEYCKNQIELKRIWGLKLYPYYDMAGVYAFKGDKKKAYENLKIFNQRQTMPLWTVTWIKTDPLFNSIRNEPEFQQILRDVEAKYQAEHERVKKWLEEQGML
jgi:TolB-like protein